MSIADSLEITVRELEIGNVLATDNYTVLKITEKESGDIVVKFRDNLSNGTEVDRVYFPSQIINIKPMK